MLFILVLKNIPRAQREAPAFTTPNPFQLLMERSTVVKVAGTRGHNPLHVGQDSTASATSGISPGSCGFKDRSMRAFSMLLVLGLAVTAFAQSDNAVVTGTVTDSQSLPIAKASVHFKALSTGAVRVVTTNERGLFYAPALRRADRRNQSALLASRSAFRHRDRRQPSECEFLPARRRHQHRSHLQHSKSQSLSRCGDGVPSGHQQLHR